MNKFSTYFLSGVMLLLSVMILTAIFFDFGGVKDDNYVVAQDHICGDGVVDIDEECDDGNTYNNDGCSSICKDEVVRVAPKAGPGLLLIFLAVVVGGGVSGLYYAYKKGYLGKEKLY